jgi:hypothetical protein
MMNPEDTVPFLGASIKMFLDDMLDLPVLTQVKEMLISGVHAFIETRRG